MKRLLLLLLAPIAFAACEKSNSTLPGKSTAELEGKWKLTEARADPGDGSGRWHAVDQGMNIIIEFDKDGSFKSNENGNPFNRYTINGDTVKLFNNININAKMVIAIQELNGQLFSYYFGWPWCGGPSGRKFIRM